MIIIFLAEHRYLRQTLEMQSNTPLFDQLVYYGIYLWCKIIKAWWKAANLNNADYVLIYLGQMLTFDAYEL